MRVITSLPMIGDSVYLQQPTITLFGAIQTKHCGVQHSLQKPKPADANIVSVLLTNPLSVYGNQNTPPNQHLSSHNSILQYILIGKVLLANAQLLDVLMTTYACTVPVIPLFWTNVTKEYTVCNTSSNPQLKDNLHQSNSNFKNFHAASIGISE